MCRGMVNFWGCLFVIFSPRIPLQKFPFTFSSFTSRPSTTCTVNGTGRLQKMPDLFCLFFNFRLFFFIIFPIY